jgi:heme oxygenase (biliverdin-IX-beta and delta-forming)
MIQDPLPSIMEQLKGETKQAHQTLEKTLDIENRLLTAESYRQLLELFYGFYQPSAAQLAAFAGQFEFWLPDLPQRVPLRLAKLKIDLEMLGTADSLHFSLAVLDSKSTLAEHMGGLYVLEGSTLGGQLISRMIRGNLGYSPEAGCAFFAGYGAQTGSMWKTFCLSLEAYGAKHPDQRRLIISGAKSTFKRFGEWILENR